MTLTGKEARFPWLFFAIAFGWAWAFWVPVALRDSGVVELPNQIEKLVAGGSFAAWGPLIGAIIAALASGGAGGVKDLLKSMVRVRFAAIWYLVALALIPAILGGSQLIASFAGEEIPASEAFANPISIPFAFVWIFFLGGPLQEEAGWRGTSTHILQEKWGALVASLATGFIWGLWHLPLFFMEREEIYYNQPIWGLMISTMLLSALLTWVYNNTGRSLFAMMLMHSSWNWANYLFTSLQTDTGGLAFFGLMILTVVLIVVLAGPERLSRKSD